LFSNLNSFRSNPIQSFINNQLDQADSFILLSFSSPEILVQVKAFLNNQQLPTQSKSFFSNLKQLQEYPNPKLSQQST
jgi:hypothetical protein